MDEAKDNIEKFNNELNTLGTIEADTTGLNDLTAIRDVLASQLATAKDALESAQSKYGHLEQWTGSIRNRLETCNHETRYCKARG